jgi:diguanylate cyclase
VSERTELHDASITTDALAPLRALGVKVALDDFGAGNSSLSYLRFLSVDILKIDRAFVRHVAEKPSARRLTEGILQLADKLSLPTVAEGIETSEQAEMLRQLGCPMSQGFHHAKPLPSDSIPDLLAVPAAT